MVSTRAQRPAATEVTVPPIIGLGDEPLAATVTSNHEQTTSSNPSRKRRRSPSSHLDEQQFSSKRSYPRKAPSPRLKRSTVPNSNARPSRRKFDQTSTHQEPWLADGDLSATALEESEANDEASHSAPQQRVEELASADTKQAGEIAETNTGIDAVMTQLIRSGEATDNQYAGRNANTARLSNSGGNFPIGPNLQFRIQSLPVLDNLAVQTLATFAHSSYQEILAITTDPQSEPGSTYSTLKSLFDHAKRVYSEREPFLSPRELGISEPEQIDIFRKANLATFVSSVFGSQDVGFYHLNEFFLDTFVIDSGRLLKNQAGLFLDLKTQAYISAIANGERSREDILQDLFPDDMEQQLLDRRPGAKQLSPGEAEFIQRARNRKRTLLEEPVTMESIAQLPDKYAWEEFLRDVSSYVSKSFAAIASYSGRKSSSNPRYVSTTEVDSGQQSRRPFVRKPAQGSMAQNVDVAPPAANSFTTRVAQMVPPDTDDIAEKAARAAEFAMQDFSANQDTSGHAERHNEAQAEQPSQQYPFQFEQQPAPYYTQNGFNNGSQLQSQLQQQAIHMGQTQNVYLNTPPVPYPTQSAPTSVLYERARMAATAKASPSNRRAGHPSQRRPWSQEEETALMAGLDHVKGPHWSQILALYGPGGTLDETLKDRNQVQLKDKARNLKLFFLKSSIEVPYYLQFVTGELKTRAPQAARIAEQRENNEQQGGAPVGELEGTAMDGGEAVGGAEDHEANMEDGEGEIIDPVEYAAVHEAGSQELGGGQDVNDMDYSNAQRQLQQAASVHDGS